MTGILEELKWETLQKRRKYNRLILLYKGLKGKARIPTDDLIPKNRRCRNQHSLVFQIPTASIDDTGYPHDGRADKDSYLHDGRADKDSYPHDRRADKNPYPHDRHKQCIMLK